MIKSRVVQTVAAFINSNGSMNDAQVPIEDAAGSAAFSFAYSVAQGDEHQCASLGTLHPQ